VIQKPAGAANATSLVQSNYQEYVQAVTSRAGSLTSSPNATLTPLTLSFPSLTDAASGQVRNGVLTVNIFRRDVQINGPIGTTIVLQPSTPNPAAPGQEVTFTATIHANDRVLPNGTADRIQFFAGGQLLADAPIGSDGTATLRTSVLPPGANTITAAFAGNADFAASTSNAIVQNVGDLNGPQVVKLDRYGYHEHPTVLVVTFDTALDPARAVAPANYRLVAAGRDNRFGTADDQIIKMRTPVYDALDHTVTLRPTSLLPIRQRFRLTVLGASSTGVTDTFGNLLDGKNNGHNGTDATRQLSRTNLIITPNGAVPGMTLLQQAHNAVSTRTLRNPHKAVQLHAARRHANK
jgi:hypothetical protein